MSKLITKLRHFPRYAKFIVIFAFIGSSLLYVTRAAGGPSMYVQPASGTFNPNQTLSITIYINTEGENVNAVQADFTYPQSRLQFQSIDAVGSAFAIDAASSGGSGTVSIARGNIADVSGVAQVAKVNFKVLNDPGVAALVFSSSSAIVRSSDSTNILNTMSGGSYTVKAPTPPPNNPPPDVDNTPAPNQPPDEPTEDDDGEPIPSPANDPDNATDDTSDEHEEHDGTGALTPGGGDGPIPAGPGWLKLNTVAIGALTVAAVAAIGVYIFRHLTPRMRGFKQSKPDFVGLTAPVAPPLRPEDIGKTFYPTQQPPPGPASSIPPPKSGV